MIMNEKKVKDGRPDAVVLTDLRKEYGKGKAATVAVDGLNVSIKEGESFALLGVNGAGKTTTMRIMAGLSYPTSGEVVVLGGDPAVSTLKVKSGLSILPQENAVAEKLTVRENLEMTAALWGKNGAEAKEKVTRIMEDLRLIDMADRPAGKLSGGYARRLSIAMALVTDPKILCLDEPTVGLDVMARRELWRILMNVRGKVTILLTTHLMEEAAFLSDRIGIMRGGKLRAVGTKDELCARTGTETLEEAFLRLVEGEPGDYPERPADPPIAENAFIPFTPWQFPGDRFPLMPKEPEKQESSQNVPKIEEPQRESAPDISQPAEKQQVEKQKPIDPARQKKREKRDAVRAKRKRKRDFVRHRTQAVREDRKNRPGRRSVWILARRGALEILRDPLGQILALLFPLVMLFIFRLIAHYTGGNTPQFGIRPLTPGIIVFSYTFAMLYTAILVSGDRSTAFLRRLFSCPLSAGDFIGGYTVSAMILMTVQTWLCFAGATLLAIPDRSFISFLQMLEVWASMIPVMFFFAFAGIFLGAAFSSRSAPGVGSVIISCSGFFSGAWMPVEEMGNFRLICMALPFYPAVTSGRMLTVGGWAAEKFWLCEGIVLLYTLLMGLLAQVFFRACMTSDRF